MHLILIYHHMLKQLKTVTVIFQNQNLKLILFKPFFTQKKKTHLFLFYNLSRISFKMLNPILYIFYYNIFEITTKPKINK